MIDGAVTFGEHLCKFIDRRLLAKAPWSDLASALQPTGRHLDLVDMGIPRHLLDEAFRFALRAVEAARDNFVPSVRRQIDSYAALHPTCYIAEFGLGISHPCTTFDKWRVLSIVDDYYNVISAVQVFF